MIQVTDEMIAAFDAVTHSDGRRAGIAAVFAIVERDVIAATLREARAEFARHELHGKQCHIFDRVAERYGVQL